MSPLSISAAVGAARQGLQAADWGWEKFKLSRGDYGLFWQAFEGRVSNQEHDIPWEQLQRYQLDPDFIGRVTVLIDSGDLTAKAEIREIFVRDLDPITSGRFETKEKLADQLLKAVVDSAVETATEVGKGERQQFGAIESVFDSVTQGVQLAPDAQEELLAKFRGVLEQFEAEKAAKAGQQAQEASAARAGERRPLGSLAERGDPGKSAEDLVAELADEDPDGAQRLEDLLKEGGPMEVVVFLRGRQGPEEGDTLAFLVTAARIAAQIGQFAEAEEAYVWASRLDDLEDNTRARQLVRAAAMAQVHAGEDRFRERLDQARALAPEHPGLAIAEARASRDGKWVLNRVANVAPENAQETALLHITRAQAHLALGDEQSATAELEEARLADRSNVAVREFESILPVVLAQDQLRRGQRANRRALLEAAEGFASLRQGLEEKARWDEAAQFAARTAEAYALAEEFEQAEAVIASVKRPDQLGPEARTDLGRAALVTRRPELVLSFIEADDLRPEARLLRAEAEALGGDATARQAAVASLAELLEADDEAIRQNAAFALLAASATEDDVAWNEDAAKLVAAARPMTAALLRAEHLWRNGEHEAAVEALLPHAGERQALRRLRDYAAQDKDFEKALDRSRSLIKQEPNALDRLTHAAILRDSGDEAEAKKEWRAIAEDKDLADQHRADAFRSLMELVGPRDYGAMRDLARDWHDQLPKSTEAVWHLAYALARLAEHAEAYKLLTDNEAEARNLDQAQLVSEVLYRGAPKEEAVPRLDALSSSFERPEQLEGLLFMAFLEAEQEGIEFDEDLAKEIAERFNAFPERFPDSKLMSRVELPDTAEGLTELLRELHGESAEAQARVQKQIADGELPVAALAVVSTVKEVGAAWARLRSLPMSFAIPALDQHERAIAADALGGAAIWDPTSLCIAGGLGPEIEAKIKAALPGSMIANETLDDAAAASTGPGRRGRSETEMGYNPSAEQGFIEEIPAEEVERQRLRAEGMLRLAKELDVQPAPGQDADQDLVKLLDDPEESHAWKTFIGTVMLAERTKRPIYSDDRWIRKFAHEHGLRAFGTLALLDVMRERGMLEETARTQARLRLSASGGWGVALTPEEMALSAREAAWDISAAVTGAFWDRATWRGRPGERMEEFVALFQFAYDEAPETLGKWLRRAISAGTTMFPHLSSQWWVRTLLLLAWGIEQPKPTVSQAAFHALIEEVKSLPPYLTGRPANDPVLAAMDETLSYFAGMPGEVRAYVFRRLQRRLPGLDGARAIHKFVVR